MKLVTFKKGGEQGEVAINPAQITHVRDAPGSLTDIYFGQHRVVVGGTFAQVVRRLMGEEP